MCFDPPVGASMCPPQGVYLVQQPVTELCYEKPSEELILCDYLSLVTPIVGGPFPYPFNAQVTVFNTGQLPPAPPPALPPQVVSNHAELQALINDQLIATAEQEGIYPFSGATVTVSGPDTVQVDGVQILLQGMNQLVPPVFVSLEFQSLDMLRTSATSLLPFTEQNCQLTTLDAERWLKIICSNGTITWFDIIRCEFGTPPPGLGLCVEGAGVDIKYQPVCVDGTTQLTRADLWQDGSLLSSFYLDASGAIVPTPVGVVTVGSCPVPILTECYYKRVSVSCLYRSNIVINPPSPVYPFDIHVTELNWVGGGGLAVLPPQTVNDDTEANAAVKAMIEAIASANGLIGYPVNANPNLFYIGGIPNNGYRAIVEIENVDQSNAIIDYTIDIGGVVTMSNFSEISCNNVPIDPQEYWEKIVYPDGSIVWWDSVNCVFGEPPDGLVLCGSEVNFIGRSKELGAGETWAITTDVGGILQSVTFNILSGTAQYIDLPTLTPTTYPIGNWSWGVNGAIDNENLLVGTMTVGIGGSMIVQWTERV